MIDTTTKDKKERTPMPKWARITLLILRKLIVPVLCIIALYAGLIVGYVVVGKQPISDVFHWGTWKHGFDLIFAK